jgi:hypothetical protein
VKVRLQVIEVPDIVRRALRAQSGQPGLATRKEIRTWVDMMIDATSADLIYDLDPAEEKLYRARAKE